jgi:tRNA threonylcarbamoyladenosine biosynthesis protein TsaE
LIYKINNLEETNYLAKKFAHKLKKRVILLNGDLGAGKTTFVKAIAEEYGNAKQVSSPTFTILQEYETSESLILHFDLYRLNSIYELDNIGFFEYLEQDATIFIEWANKLNLKEELGSFIDFIEINIKIIDEDKREFEIKGI